MIPHTRYLQSIAITTVLILALASCHGFFTDPVLTSINITPSNPNVAVGSTQQFSATGVHDDGSTSNVNVTWSSSTPAVATINSGGLATAVATGTSTITATSTGTTTLTGTTTMTVTTSTLTSITITDTNGGTINNIGGTDQFHAMASFADGSTKDITSTATWTSSNTGIATINSSGLATGVAAGTTQITASSGNVNSTAFTLTVI